MKHLIAPSLLAADFTRLGEEVAMVNNSEADWLHFDVMDGRFVPNISFGIPVLEAVNRVAQKPIDVHLMIEKPEHLIGKFREAGAEVITVHYETCPHILRTLQLIRSTGAKAGVAINPGTPVTMLEDILEDADLFLIMSVNPGFGGQKFIYRSIHKIKQLRGMLDERNIEAHIEVDGGVGLQNAEILLEAGANVLVAGNTVFSASDPHEMISRLKHLSANKFADF
jgi:ribulose-phosphate 3-epimerase